MNYIVFQYKNTFNVFDNMAEIVVLRKNGEIHKVIIDIYDISKTKDHKWCIGSHGYALSFINNKHILLHRYIFDSKLQIDHINRNKLDNRKVNLRCATRKQNMSNHGIRSSNKTGYKGVSMADGKYIAHITFSGYTKHLGRFKTPEEAATAYNNAAKIYHGEFAFLNEVSNA